MEILVVLLLLIALVLFLVSAFGWSASPRVNLQSLGLAFLAGAFLVPAIQALS